jgi:long-chain fatty acid transport protein
MFMKNSKTCQKIGLTSVCFLSAATVATDGGGFDLPDQDAFAVGRGLAVVATADNPSAIFYNPAGLTQLTGTHLEAGIYGIYLDPQFTPNGGGNTFHNQDPFGGVPQLFLVHGNDKQTFSFGLGIYAPSGLNVKWQDGTGFRTLGTLGSLAQFAINPVVAFKLLPSLSIGGGLSANYANLDLRQGILWPGQPFDQFRFQGDGWGLEGNAGLLWQPLQKISVGLALQTGMKTDLDGYTTAYNSVATPLAQPPFFYPAFSTRTSAKADFRFPLKAEAGLSYRPTTNWNVEADADYTDWNSMGTVNIQQAHAFPPLFPQDIAVPLQWKSSWYFELGATRYFGDGWHVSAGYLFNQNAVPSAHYNVLVADEDRHFFSVGLGRKCKNFDFDIAYQFGFGPDRTVSGSAPSATGQTANGTYGFISHAIAVSLGWHF